MQSRRRWSGAVGDAPRCLTRHCFLGVDFRGFISFCLSSAVLPHPHPDSYSLPGAQPPLPVPPPTQNPVQPSRPVQAVRPGHVGQPLHSHRGVLGRTPGLAELPLWRHLHPAGLLAHVAAHALALTLAKLHHHTSPGGQKRLQGPGYFHLSEAVLTIPAPTWAVSLPPPPLFLPPPSLLLVSSFLRIPLFALVRCSVEHCLLPQPWATHGRRRSEHGRRDAVCSSAGPSLSSEGGRDTARNVWGKLVVLFTKT